MANRVTVSENAAPRPAGSIAMNTRAQVHARPNQAQNAPQASLTSDPAHDERDARMTCLEDNLFRLTGALARIGGTSPPWKESLGEGSGWRPRLNVNSATPDQTRTKRPRTQISEVPTANAPSSRRVAPTYR